MEGDSIDGLWTVIAGRRAYRLEVDPLTGFVPFEVFADLQQAVSSPAVGNGGDGGVTMLAPPDIC